MPTYVYECSKCNSTFEIEQRITENALDTCQCGSVGTVKRLIQPIAVMFKGSGFHINDYAAKGAEPTAKSDAATETAKTEPPAAETKSEPTVATAPTPVTETKG